MCPAHATAKGLCSRAWRSVSTDLRPSGAGRAVLGVLRWVCRWQRAVGAGLGKLPWLWPRCAPHARRRHGGAAAEGAAPLRRPRAVPATPRGSPPAPRGPPSVSARIGAPPPHPHLQVSAWLCFFLVVFFFPRLFWGLFGFGNEYFSTRAE